MTYKDLIESLEILDLSGEMSLPDIKKKFRRLSKKYHPDLCKDEIEICNEKMDKIKKAYNILEEYCTKFNFKFTQKEFYDQFPEEKVKEHYYNSGLWGRKD